MLSFRLIRSLPICTAKHVCVYDGKDRSIAKSDYSGLLLRDDPEYAVYWKMLKMNVSSFYYFQGQSKFTTSYRICNWFERGLPMEAAKHACVRDGKDPSTMDLDPDWVWI